MYPSPLSFFRTFSSIACLLIISGHTALTLLLHQVLLDLVAPLVTRFPFQYLLKIQMFHCLYHKLTFSLNRLDP